MSERIRIAVDAMSGDFGPRAAICGLRKALQQNPLLDALLIGSELSLQPLLQSLISSPKLRSRIEVIDAPTVVTMADNPVAALRHKRDSSMASALELVANKRAKGCVSAGNTGALLALSRSIIGMDSGLSRPALAKFMPKPDASGSLVSGSLMLDLGANPDASPSQLLEFAQLASDFCLSPQPSVKLLNIGVEPGKGDELVRETDELLKASELNYQGFIEANQILSGDCDIIVCDGFSGNIALKASEGTARFIAQRVREDVSRLSQRLWALLAWPLLRRWRQKFNPGRFNGALLLGLAGVVYKSHGGADADAFAESILAAARAIEDRKL